MQNANPLFPGQDNNDNAANVPASGSNTPVGQHSDTQNLNSEGLQHANPAADLIREKLQRIYAEEPDTFAEERQSEIVSHRSKHQEFMYRLTTSGKSLAEIQTEWHAYYHHLPDEEKHQVWQEFYEANSVPRPQHHLVPPAHTAEAVAIPAPAQTITRAKPTPLPQPQTAPSGIVVSKPEVLTLLDKRRPIQIKQAIRDKVSAGGKLRARHHIQSIAFGLTVGVITLVIFLFGFFNETFIAPFIQPGRTASATPIIVDPSTITASTTPEIIIPKINLEIPVDFSQTSTNEATIENALEGGIVHYPSTVMPGQLGNAAFFGHSSNNIFNPGKYKFAFVLLHELVPGDTFYVTYNSKVYIYKVSSRQIVPPSDVSVLNNIPDHPATATLITCDPPGTSINRLIVVGDQISPDPTANSGGNNTSTVSIASPQLPGNGPTLLGRLWSWLF